MVEHMKTNTLGVSCGRILESVGMRNLVLGCAIASLFQMGGGKCASPKC